MRRVVILGSSGQIGSAFAKRIAPSYESVSWESLSQTSVAQAMEAVLSTGWDLDFILAGGVTDPKLPPETILDSNLRLIQKVVDTALRHKPEKARYRFVTLGTIHECFPALSKTNPYLESKVLLGNWMQTQAELHGSNFMHVRLQTIYGSEPRAHMFLGQILHALKENRPFLMSSGEQLREYHHADEIAVALENLLARDWDFGSSINVCSGNAIRLANLAVSIFGTFGKPELLQIGAIPTRQEENREQTFERSPEWLVPYFRQPIPGIIDCLAENLGYKEHSSRP